MEITRGNICERRPPKVRPKVVRVTVTAAYGRTGLPGCPNNKKKKEKKKESVSSNESKSDGAQKRPFLYDGGFPWGTSALAGPACLPDIIPDHGSVIRVVYVYIKYYAMTVKSNFLFCFLFFFCPPHTA